jgi:hypothetical protein
MDIDGETSQPPETRLSQLPEDDYGAVRERRDFGPMNIQLHPILPSPFRDASFSGLTGWRYYPTAHEVDRLGLGNDFVGKPSTEMVIPLSWSDRVVDHSKATESSRRQLEKLKSWEDSKQRKRKIPGEDSQDVSMLDDAPVTNDSSSANPTSVKDLRKSASTKVALSEEATVVTASTSSTVTSSRTSASANTLASASTASPVALATDLVPKQELFFLYQTVPRKVHLKNADYLTWGNDKSAHELLYSSVFVCPITKEIFLAGSYGDSSVKEGGVHWYSTKKVAEHAAAARAWDCWNMREGRHGEKRASLESPYSKQDAPELPIYQFPAEIREKIQEIQKEQAKLEEELKNKPPSPQRQSDDRNSNYRGKSDRRDYDRSQGGHWNKRGRGRGRWDQYSSTYHRQQRYPSYAYNDRQNASFDQQREQGTGNFSTGYGGSSRQQREQSAAVGSYSTGYGGSSNVYSGSGEGNSGAQRTGNGANHNHSSQDYPRGVWQQDEPSNASLPPTDAPTQNEEGPIQFRRLQDFYTNDNSMYDPPSKNEYSEEW